VAIGRSGRRGTLVSLAVGGLLGALLLAGVRTEIQRLRYERAEIIRQNRVLDARLSELTARTRALRDPMRLSRLARKRGFTRPRMVIQLGLEMQIAARDLRQ
jgi:hypothetical protein